MPGEPGRVFVLAGLLAAVIGGVNVDKPWKATVRDALMRESGQFWDNLKSSPDWAAFESKIAQIIDPPKDHNPDPQQGQQTNEV